MTFKSKIIKLFSLFSLITIGATVFSLTNSHSVFTSKALDEQHTMSLTTYNGGSSGTYTTTNGNNITFSFYECYKVTYGFLRVSDGATIRNTTPIHGIKSLIVNADNYPDECFLEYNIFLNSQSKYKQSYGKLNQKLNVSVDNDGFSITFDDEYIIKSLVIEYSCN